jgi:ubiquitin-protein ligase E3 B
MGKVLAKAVYEGILVDAQFASFFLARILGRNVFLEQLQELDTDVSRNLGFVKRYDGDIEDLCLSFSADIDFFNEKKTVDLKYVSSGDHCIWLQRENLMNAFFM